MSGNTQFRNSDAFVLKKRSSIIFHVTSFQPFLVFLVLEYYLLDLYIDPLIALSFVKRKLESFTWYEHFVERETNCCDLEEVKPQTGMKLRGLTLQDGFLRGSEDLCGLYDDWFLQWG